MEFNKYEVIVDMFYKCLIIYFNVKYDGLENNLIKKWNFIVELCEDCVII